MIQRTNVQGYVRRGAHGCGGEGGVGASGKKKRVAMRGSQQNVFFFPRAEYVPNHKSLMNRASIKGDPIWKWAAWNLGRPKPTHLTEERKWGIGEASREFEPEGLGRVLLKDKCRCPKVNPSWVFSGAAVWKT